MKAPLYSLILLLLRFPASLLAWSVGSLKYYRISPRLSFEMNDNIDKNSLKTINSNSNADHIVNHGESATHSSTARRRSSSKLHKTKKIMNEAALKFLNDINDNDLSSHDFARLLQRASQSRTRVELNDEGRKEMVKILRLKIPNMSPHAVSITLWSLGSLRMPVRSVEQLEVCDMLIEKLTQRSNEMGVQSIFMSLVGLARLGIRWTSYSNNNNNNNQHNNGKSNIHFFTSVSFALEQMDDHQVASTIWALGKIGVQWSLLPSRLRRSVIKSLVRTSPKMNPVSISNTLHGLSTLKADWYQLPVEMTEALQRGLRRCSRRMREQEVSNSLSGLGRLGAQWKELPFSTRNSLGAAFRHVLLDLNAQGITMSIHGLGRMGASWLGLPLEFRISILTALEEHTEDFNAQEVSNVIYGLGRMGVKWTDLKSSQTDALSLAINSVGWQMSSQGVANTLYGLGLSDARFKTLSGGTRSVIYDALSREVPYMFEQELASVFMAMGQMKVTWSVIPDHVRSTLLVALEHKLKEMDAQGVVMSLQGLSSMGYDFKSIRSMSMSSSYNNNNNNNNNISGLGSALVQTISRVLQPAATISEHRSNQAKSKSSKKQSQSQSISSSLDMRSVSALVHALSTAGFDWDQLPDSISGALINIFLYDSQGEETSSSSTSSSSSSSGYKSVGLGSRNYADLFTVSGSSSSSSSSSYSGSYSGAQGRTTSSHGEYVKDNNHNPDNNYNNNNHNRKLKSKGTGHNNKLNKNYNHNGNGNGNGKLKLDIEDVIAAAKHRASSATTDRARSMSNHGQLPTIGQAKLAAASNMGLDVFTRTTAPIATATITTTSTSTSATTSSSNRIQVKSSRRSSGSSVSTAAGTSNHGISSNGYNNKINNNNDNNSNQGQRSSIMSLMESMGRMGAQWSTLNAEGKEALTQRILEELPRLSSEDVPSFLHAMSTMGATWSELPVALRDAFIDALAGASIMMSSRGISVTILSLAKLDVYWRKDLPKGLRMLLRQSISRQSELGEHSLSSLLYGLAKLGRKWRDLHPDLHTSLKEGIVVCHVRDSYSALGVANSLLGLAGMDVEWSQLSSSVTLAIVDEVVKVAPLTTDTQLVNIIWSLARMGLRWDLSPVKVQRSLVDGVKRFASAGTFNEQHLSSLIFSLGTMGCRFYDDLPVKLQNDLLDCLYRTQAPGHQNKSSKNTDIANNNNNNSSSSSSSSSSRDRSKLSPQGLSMTLVGFVKMGVVDASALPRPTFLWLKQAVTSLSSKMSSRQLAVTVHGLSKMGVTWGSIGHRGRNAIIDSIHKHVYGSGVTTKRQRHRNKKKKNGNEENNYSNSNSLEEQNSFDIRLLEHLNIEDMATILKALGTLGVRWSDLNVSSKAALTSVLYTVAETGDAAQVSAAVFGLGLMECRWSELSARMRAALREAIRRVAFEDTPKCRSLAVVGDDGSYIESCEIGFYEEDIDSSDGAESLFDHVSFPTAVANMVYSLSLLVFDLQDKAIHWELEAVHISLLDAVSRCGIGQFKEEEREQILIYLSILRTLVPHDEHFVSIDERERNLDGSIIRVTPKMNCPSKLQERMVWSLTDSLKRRSVRDLEVADEYSAFGGAFPVDATIFDNENNPVAFLEVDGPHHFIRGELRRKDRMKEALYRSKHPSATFCRVSYDQVSRLGAKRCAESVANFVTLASGLEEHEQWVSRRAERELVRTLGSPVTKVVKKKMKNNEKNSSKTKGKRVIIDDFRDGVDTIGGVSKTEYLDRTTAGEGEEKLKNAEGMWKIYLTPTIDTVYADVEEDNS